jgi:hypothetical protein
VAEYHRLNDERLLQRHLLKVCVSHTSLHRLPSSNSAFSNPSGVRSLSISHHDAEYEADTGGKGLGKGIIVEGAIGIRCRRGEAECLDHGPVPFVMATLV